MTIKINVVPTDIPLSTFSGRQRDRVEIAGNDVTLDLIKIASLGASLDVESLNNFRVSEATFSLRNTRGKYNVDIQDNFWSTHSLNPEGFQEKIEIFKEYFVSGNWTRVLQFSGFIHRTAKRENGTTIVFTAVDISTALRNRQLQGIGTGKKCGTARAASDESSYEQVFAPEASLLPLLPAEAAAWRNETALTRRELALPTEGPPLSNTFYPTLQDIRLPVATGEQDAPLVRSPAQLRSQNLHALIRRVALHLDELPFQVRIDAEALSVDTPYILNRGSRAFDVLDTRITHVPVDWVKGRQGTGTLPNTIFVLLSNPESHIADLLVSYDLESERTRVLHTFDKTLAVHRIERRTALHYYILTSDKITQDGSARTLPRPSDKTEYGWDSVAEGSRIRIYRYDVNSSTLTEHVPHTNTYPPQLGIHYYAGFENAFQTDEFEGIRPEYRGAFKWQGSHLYYRYAKRGEFGVARVNASGTTERLMHETDLELYNHLNFAFDVTTTGTVYWGYATSDTVNSTLTIKRRTSVGVVSTVLSVARTIGAFNELGDEWGVFLGCHEALFHNNYLYLLVPIQKIEYGEDSQSKTATPSVTERQMSAEKTGERNVTSSTGLNPTAVAPGADIRLRIHFDGLVSGATQRDFTVYGATIQSVSILSTWIDVTLRPDSKTYHKTIYVDLAEDAVSEGNEAWRITIDFGTDRSRTKTAGMVLYRCNVTAQNPSLTVVEKYDFVQHGACNLTVHDGKVHFVEQPKVSARWKPVNSDLSSFNESLGYNSIPEALGALKRIESDGTITHLGNWWFDSDRALNLALTRCLSIGDDLHVTMGYGDPDAVLRLNSLASKPDNAQHLVHTSTLQETLLNAGVSGNIWSTLVSLTTLLDATVSIENNIIHIRSRRVTKAVTAGATGTGSGSLTFRDANKAFPSSGYLLIGTEMLGYTGITGGAFTGVQRGVLGSAIVNHPDGSGLLFAKYVFDEGDLVGRITPVTDTGKLYNVIRDSQGVVSVRDATSVAKFGEKVLTLNFSRLSAHESAWQAAIFKQYLENLKDLQQLMTFSLLPSRYLRLGDILGLRHEGSVYPIQVLSLRHTPTRTEVRGRTVTLKGRVETGIYSDGHGNLYSDGHGNVYTDGV